MVSNVYWYVVAMKAMDVMVMSVMSVMMAMVRFSFGKTQT